MGAEPDELNHSTGHKEHQHADTSPSSTTQALPKLVRSQTSTYAKQTVSAGRAIAGAKPEVVTLEGPGSLDQRVIERRLEEQSKAARSKSFDQYKKDYDLYTGIRRQRYAPERLHEDEKHYVQRLEGLVGSRSEPSLKLPRFHQSGGV